jgi:hypothetical protein
MDLFWFGLRCVLDEHALRLARIPRARKPGEIRYLPAALPYRAERRRHYYLRPSSPALWMAAARVRQFSRSSRAGHMHLDRARAEVKPVGRLLVGQAGREQSQHIVLTIPSVLSDIAASIPQVRRPVMRASSAYRESGRCRRTTPGPPPPRALFPPRSSRGPVGGGSTPAR